MEQLPSQKLTRAEQSRINGAKSRGPVTPEGKAISAMNASKHNLTGAQVLLKGEDPEPYYKFRDSLIARFAPTDPLEHSMVEELAAATWRKFRILGMESCIYKFTVKQFAEDILRSIPDATPADEAGIAWFEQCKSSLSLPRLNRYEAHIRRTFDRALANLRSLQAEKQKLQNEPENQPVSNAPGLAIQLTSIP